LKNFKIFSEELQETIYFIATDSPQFNFFIFQFSGLKSKLSIQYF